MADVNCRLINVNQSVMELFGYSREEILGLGYLYHLLRRRVQKQHHGGVQGKGVRARGRGQTAAQRRHYSWSACCQPLCAGPRAATLGFQGIFHDITKRKRSEEVLIRQNEYLAALNETTKGLMSRLDLDSLLTAIINRAGALMKTSHSYIYLLDPTGDRMTRQSTTGVFNDFFDFQIRTGDGLVGQVWQTGLPISVDNYHAWSGRLPDPAREVLRAMVGVPLKSGDHVVGVIGLAHVEEGRRFGDEEVDILTRFAELASLALDNARLYAEAQEELQERKRAEEQLRKLSHAVEQSPVSVIITDTTGTIEYVNPKFTETTGFTSDEVTGQTPRLLKSGETPMAEYRGLWKRSPPEMNGVGSFITGRRMANSTGNWHRFRLSEMRKAPSPIILPSRKISPNRKNWKPSSAIPKRWRLSASLLGELHTISITS